MLASSAGSADGKTQDVFPATSRFSGSLEHDRSCLTLILSELVLADPFTTGTNIAGIVLKSLSPISSGNPHSRHAAEFGSTGHREGVDHLQFCDNALAAFEDYLHA